MPVSFYLATNTEVTPVERIDQRASVGLRCIAKRSGPGSIGVEIRRGDGGLLGQFPDQIAYTFVGPLLAGEEVEIRFATIDMPAADTFGRLYQMGIHALGGVDTISVRDANIGTMPYSEPGIVPP